MIKKNLVQIYSILIANEKMEIFLNKKTCSEAIEQEFLEI
jgi:hypothetical protein